MTISLEGFCIGSFLGFALAFSVFRALIEPRLRRYFERKMFD